MQADVVIAGLGVTGAAVAWETTSRGHRVIGLDARRPPHTDGSSHGATRIIRQAYFEHPLYVPLVQRAYERWSSLEQASGRTLYQRTGGVAVGPEDSTLVSGALRSVREHALEHEFFDAAALHARFPALVPASSWVGVLEPNAGALFAESCVQTLHDMARSNGATLLYDTSLLRWRSVRGGLEIETSAGTIWTESLVLSLGSWLPRFVNLPLTVERQVVFWFEPHADPRRFKSGHCPIALWEYQPDCFAYAFPDLGNGIKAGIHHGGDTCTPETMQRIARAEEEQSVRNVLERFMPGAGGRAREASVCLYTNTPDFDFIVDAHPDDKRVVIASACSGHGFKFAPVIAELVADLCSGREPAFDIAPFRVDRLGVRGR